MRPHSRLEGRPERVAPYQGYGEDPGEGEEWALESEAAQETASPSNTKISLGLPARGGRVDADRLCRRETVENCRG